MLNERKDDAAIRWTAPLCLLLMPLACSSPSPSPNSDSDIGTLEINLAASDQTGRRYRLRDAQFFVAPRFGEVDGGPFSVVLSSENGPDDERITARLHPGSYSVDLQPGWRMEDVTATPVGVPAILLSDTAVSFDIRRFRTSFVNYEFGVNGDPLAFGGDVSIGITVVSRDAGAPTAP